MCRWRQRHCAARVRERIYCSVKLKMIVPVTSTGCPERRVGEKRQPRAACAAAVRSNGCPLTAVAETTRPSGLIVTCTVTGPDARTAFAFAGYGGCGLEIACPFNTPPDLLITFGGSGFGVGGGGGGGAAVGGALGGPGGPPPPVPVGPIGPVTPPVALSFREPITVGTLVRTDGILLATFETSFGATVGTFVLAINWVRTSTCCSVVVVGRSFGCSGSGSGSRV